MADVPRGGARDSLLIIYVSRELLSLFLDHYRRAEFRYFTGGILTLTFFTFPPPGVEEGRGVK